MRQSQPPGDWPNTLPLSGPTRSRNPLRSMPARARWQVCDLGERRDPQFANLATGRVVRPSSRCADERGVLLWHELGCGVDADGAARRRLPIASVLPAQQASRCCRSRDRAGIRRTAELTAQMATITRSSHIAVIGCSNPRLRKHRSGRTSGCWSPGCPGVRFARPRTALPVRLPNVLDRLSAQKENQQQAEAGFAARRSADGRTSRLRAD
jgi:hypothetical protein